MGRVSAALTRRQLVSRGARGGAALLVAGTALGQLPDEAAADPLSTADLAYGRLLVAAELLASDFYTQAIAASNSSPGVMKYLKRAYANEQEHYEAVAGILSGAGVTPAVSSDIDFTYPRGAFGSQASILKLAQQLETILLGTYLGAVGGMQSSSFKQGLAQIAASEAQHLSYMLTKNGLKAFNVAFPPALTIDQASAAMDAFTS
jgi:Ferritin-like domain